MKRRITGPSMRMAHQGRYPPLSCRLCREKKRRCDRTLPCSNCSQRGLDCEYVGRQSFVPEQSGEASLSDSYRESIATHHSGSTPSTVQSGDPGNQ
ncbi:hypothetical protein V2G26_004009 [Clonostachys chloroleuca]